MTYLLRINPEGPFALAVRTKGDSNLLLSILVEWTKYCSTFAAVKLHIFQLREDTTSARDDPAHADQMVEMATTKVSKGFTRWQVRDTHMDLVVDIVICWIECQDCIVSNLVENGEHHFRRRGEEISKDGLR